MQFVQLDTCAAENFEHYVTSRASRQKFRTWQDRYSTATIEETVYYRGSKVLGKLVRNRCGYQYFLRKENKS